MENLKEIIKVGFVLFSFASCSGKSEENKQESKGFELSGKTQGTTFNIKIADKKLNVSSIEIIETLARFDRALSTYIDNSLISAMNSQPSGERNYIDSFGYFTKCYEKSQLVFERSKGAFDPSVFPLVKGWGFFDGKNTPLDSSQVRSILKDVDFTNNNLHRFTSKNSIITLIKLNPNFKFDFNAIAQGYAVDVLAELLISKGHKNFYIEIGGELRTSGKNISNEKWKIGIDEPTFGSDQKSREIKKIIQISNKSLATSGNYRKFYEKDGKKYAHTLNPKTGFPVEHNLLSASVKMDECALADAYATVFMVIGFEKSKMFILEHADLKIEAYLLYSDAKGEIKSFETVGF